MLIVAWRIAIHLSSMLCSFYIPLDIANSAVPYTEVAMALMYSTQTKRQRQTYEKLGISIRSGYKTV